MGTVGGPQSFFQVDSVVLNNSGVLAGWSDTAVTQSSQFCFYRGDGFASDAFEWRDGMRIDFPVLPGGTSSQAVWIAPNGLIAGYSQNGQTDPLVGGSPQSRAVLGRDTQAIDLGSLGRNESTAYAVMGRSNNPQNSQISPYSLSHRKPPESDAKASQKTVRLARFGLWKAASAISMRIPIKLRS
jgi:hypothetical protein